MGEFFKSLRKKLSAEDVKPKRPQHQDEDVARVLRRVDPNDIVDPDEMAATLKQLHAKKSSKFEMPTPAAIMETVKSAIEPASANPNTVQKPPPKTQSIPDNDAYTKEPTSFLD